MSENRIKEIIFLVEEDDEGGYIAKAINQSIFTQADSLQELRELVKDAVHCHYPDEQNRPQLIHLHIVRDEVIAS
ncbi:2-oxoisovalerate dehydrogenase [Anabaena sp. UHCC 0253]|uniref:2-oxoisovalerate dehydrogenase n=1 Tax=Anabaena sp. UHCC 0253 TaxID=2590019 RepID=UPI001445393B|nr:2-oxoisovalerate dehydrogenase [Anabaena sp. UHCC 0253]MTJ51733.1 2-oxoisovalerate dehydrogenase [Anabaena sp. UHCC 0253]